MATIPQSNASPAQKAYYVTFLVPMWRGQLDQLASAMRGYRHHLLALECLRVAKGPGADPYQLAEFCRKWQIPMTAPMIGPVALLRKAGKAVGAASPAAAAFDPTGAINIGIKILGHLGPLIGQIQIRNAMLVAMDRTVVPIGDDTSVLTVLQAAGTPQALLTRVKGSKDNLSKVWDETLSVAEKMEGVRQELGLPENQ